MALDFLLPGLCVDDGLIAHELGHFVEQMVDHVVNQLARKLVHPMLAVGEDARPE